MVGPWPHGIGTPECGATVFGPDTSEDEPTLIAEWFDHLLHRLPFEIYQRSEGTDLQDGWRRRVSLVARQDEPGRRVAHRIGLAAACRASPTGRSGPATGTGEPAGAWTHQVTAHNTVCHDAKRGSYIELPLMPKQ
jgi:hypothetical protein